MKLHDASGYTVTDDPRLVEWFRRTKASPLSAPPVQSEGFSLTVGSQAATPAKDVNLFSLGNKGKKKAATLPPSVRKSISEETRDAHFCFHRDQRAVQGKIFDAHFVPSDTTE